MKIGIDLGGTNVRVALVDDRGIVAQLIELCKADQPEEVVLNHIKEMIGRLITSDVEGIGVGVPSIVDPQRGIVYDVMNIPSWKEVPIKKILESEFNLPVFVNNDANCFALGEKYYGRGKLFDDMVGVTLGTGVGAGIIINGHLYGGKNTCAGEIGCLPYLDDIYEHYCSSMFFVNHFQTTGLDAYNDALKGNAQALDIWIEFGRHVGNLLSAVLYTYDPEAIILGGSISRSYVLFKEGMNESLKKFMYPPVVEKITIEVSSMDNIGVLGAASLTNDVQTI